ncbi:MAG: glycosyltransferase family 2 protein [Microgenomates group bacterium]
MKHIDVSVIILNFNTLELTKIAIEKLLASALPNISMEIIVCDNASTDGTDIMIKKEFPQVTFIQNGGNVGFAAGNNPGIKIAKGRYVLLLNSDTEVAEDAIATMIKFMDAHPQCGASTCKLLLMDGSIDPACHRGMPTPWNALTYYLKMEKLFPNVRCFSGYHQLYKDLTTIHEVDCISGAFFLVRREVIDKVGMLDEAYFMYGEDIDWAYRIKEAGWQIWYNPTVTILHKKKQSGRSHANRERRIKTQTMFITYNKLFYTKHYEKKYNPIITWLVYTAFDLQLVGLKLFGL